MAKDKKRGFFSWFGRGRQEEEQQKEFLETAREIPEETLLIILFEGKPDARTKSGSATRSKNSQRPT